ncbi:MAG: energy-coupling factor transporter transmembrane protein EcfT [Nitrospirae bacterium]|nr:MAG: energy-coupling factor transporter transmembrane protein EcfT [Nitrospirota bacterium]
MSFSLHLDYDTWVHRLDARTKIVVTSMLFVLALVFSDPAYLLVILGAVLLGMHTARALPNVRKLWVLLVLLFLYSSALWPFFVTGSTTMWMLGPLHVTREGLLFGVGMGLRLNLMVISGLWLLSTTTVEAFAVGLQRLGIPASMGFAFSLAFRWVPTLLGAGSTIVQAQRSRGLDLSSGSVLDRLRRYPPLVVPLVGHVFRQTLLLATALESKGFGPGTPRTVYRSASFGWQDGVVLVGLGMLTGVSVWLRLHGFGAVQVGF